MYRLLFSALLLPIFTSAQYPVRIVDSASGRGLPYATVACPQKSWGRVTDAEGAVLIPDSLLGSAFELSYVGYVSKRVPLHTVSAISLVPKPPLPAVTITGCSATQPVRLGTARPGELEKKARWKGFWIDTNMRWSGPLDGAMMTVWVANDAGKPGWLSGLTFGVCPFWNDRRYQGFANTPVRLRFFARDTSGKPGIELTRDDIRVAAEKFGALHVSLDAYRIPLPGDGIFVAFEIFNAGRDYWWQVKFNGPPPPQAITEVYGFSYQAHSAGAVPMYFISPLRPAWEILDTKPRLELAVALEARVCK